MLYLTYSFFKKNQQFITQSVRADHGSYLHIFRLKQHGARKKRKREDKQKREKKLKEKLKRESRERKTMTI